MWMEVQLAERIRSENIFLYLLHCFSVNFWDIRVVSKQAGCLNERFAFLAFISVVSQLLLRKRFL